MGVVVKTERNKTLTLNLSDRESAGLERLAAETEMTKSAVLRAALRLYDLVHARTKAGETMHFSGDQKRAMEMVGSGFSKEPHP